MRGKLGLMSSTSSKKRKHDSAATDYSAKSKKTKQSGISRTDGFTSDRKDKGKSRAADGEFTIVQSTLRLAIAPIFTQNPKAGAEEMLDSMIMRYFERVIHTGGLAD